MGIFDGVLIATDLDGTLLNKEGKISAENSEAIRYFQKEGGIFTAATGRYPDFLDAYKENFAPNKYILALNGNLIYDIENDCLFSSSVMNRDELEKLMADVMPKIADNCIRINVCCEDTSHQYDGRLYDNVCKVVFVLDNEDFALWLRDYMRENYGDKYKVERSWNTGVEIYNACSGKGESVNLIKANLPDIKTTVGIGDYENDISLLALADIGYAVGNSVEEAISAADVLVPVDNSHSAVAWVINDLKRRLK